MNKISFDSWSDAQMWAAHADMIQDGDLDGAAQFAQIIRNRQPVNTFHFFDDDDVFMIHSK